MTDQLSEAEWTEAGRAGAAPTLPEFHTAKRLEIGLQWRPPDEARGGQTRVQAGAHQLAKETVDTRCPRRPLTGFISVRGGPTP